MDFSSLKTINDDCLFIRSKLGHELEKVINRTATIRYAVS